MLLGSRTQRSVSGIRNNESQESAMPNFDTPAPITAVLDLPAGRVRLTAADRTDTTVEVRPADTAKSRDVRMAEETTVDFRDGVLRIQAPTKNQILGPSGIVEVTVQLPTGSRL
jgi:hypothetical protein